MSRIHRVTAIGSGLLLGSALLLAGCGRTDSITNDSVGRAQASQALGQWAPPDRATCTTKDHNRYSVLGPDGVRYPTWHPAVDPVTGCTFGHDHGPDPRGSRLYRTTGAIPFGLANEAVLRFDGGSGLADDHTGHRIVWANDVMLQQTVGGKPVDIGVRCDVLMKVFRGDEGRAHELAYHVRCDDGTELHATRMVELRNGVAEAYLTSEDGGHLAFFDPGLGEGEQAHGGVCPECITFNQTGIYNAGGPTTWYTDPMGGHAQTRAFPGSIRQFIAAVNNDRGFALAPQLLGAR